jgi:1-acyl-sn-glycerol-3-phosphate acyltransferase
VGRSIVQALARFLMRILLRLEVVGLEKLPEQGPVIVIFNHIAWIDPLPFLVLIRRPLAAMGKETAIGLPVLGIFIKMLGGFAVRRGEVDRRALRHSLAALQRGEVLVLAPEGTRSPGKSLQKGKRGLAFIAGRSGAPVMPAAITGSEDVLRCWLRLRQPRIRLTFGQLFRFLPPTGETGRADLQRMTDEAMYQLAALLPPSYRGVYADPPQATMTTICFLDSPHAPEGAISHENYLPRRH